MSLDADRRRRARQFWWHRADVLLELGKQVANLPPDAVWHLRSFEGTDEQGRPTLWFQLWSGAEPSGDSEPCGDPINASHTCPPAC